MDRKLLIFVALPPSFAVIWLLVVLNVTAMQPPSARVQLQEQTVSGSPGWQNLGLYGASTPSLHGIAIDPDRNTVTLCTLGVYGLYQSTDDGNSWNPVTDFLGGCSSIDYNLASRKLFWCCPDGSASASEDGGVTWQSILSSTEEYGPASLVVHPVTPTLLYASVNYQDGGRGIVRTNDGGVNWAPALLSPDGNVHAASLDTWIYVAIDPTSAHRVYGFTASSDPVSEHKGIYRSEDGGMTFQRIVTDTMGVEIVAGVSPEGTLFAAFDGKAWRSYDHGESWDKIRDYGATSISFHPADPDILWLDSSRSNDGGDTWSTDHHAPGPAPIAHPAHTTTWYGASTYGMARSDDDGLTWADINSGLEEISVIRVSADAHDQRRYYVVTPGAVGRTFDDGEQWEFPFLRDAWSDVILDPRNPDKIFALINGGSGGVVSWDGGETWQGFSIDDDLGAHVRTHRLALDPNHTETAYVAINTNGPPDSGNWGGIYKTIDGGTSWYSTTLRNVPMNTVIFISTTHTLVAGAVDMYPQDDPAFGGIYTSTDEGYSWQLTGLEQESVLDLDLDPRYPAHLYAATRSGLYKSLDGGATWSRLPVTAEPYGVVDVAVDPENPDVIYAIAERNIYRSADAGAQWQLLYQHRPGEGIPYTLFLPWLPPTPIISVTAETSAPDAVVLRWENPSDEDFSGTLVRYLTDTFPVWYGDGTLLADQPGDPGGVGTVTHSALPDSNTIYYSLFGYDTDEHYSVATQISITLHIDGSGISVQQVGRVPLSEASRQDTFILANSRGLYRVILKDQRLVFLPIVLSH